MMGVLLLLLLAVLGCSEEDGSNVANPVNAGGTGSAPLLPEGPTNVVLTVGDGQLQLSWNAVSNASTYQLRYRVFSEADDDYIDLPSEGGADITETAYVVPSLANGTQYQLQVRWLAEGGAESAWSSAVVGSPLALAAPTDLTAVVENGNLRILWGAVLGATKYFVRHKESTQQDSAYTTVNAVGGEPLSSTTFLLGNLTNGTNHIFQVRAVNALGQEGPWSTNVAGGLVGLAAPLGLMVVVENRQLRLFWDAVPGAAKYHLRHKESTQQDSAYIDLPGASGDDITATTFLLTNLTNGTNYTIRVRAVNSLGQEGPWSGDVLGTPSDILGAPSIALATNTGDNDQDAFTTEAVIKLASRPGATVVLGMSLNGGAEHAFAQGENVFILPQEGMTNIDLGLLAPSVVPTGEGTNAISLTATASLAGRNSEESEPTTFTLVAQVPQADVDAISFSLAEDSGDQGDKITTNANIVVEGTVPSGAALSFAVSTNGALHDHQITATGTNDFDLASPTETLAVSIRPTLTRHAHSVVAANAFTYTLFAWPTSLTASYVDNGATNDDGITLASELTMTGFSVGGTNLKLTSFVVTNEDDSNSTTSNLAAEDQPALSADYKVDLRRVKPMLSSAEKIYSVTFGYVGHSITSVLATALQYRVGFFARKFTVPANSIGIAVNSNDVVFVTSTNTDRIHFYDTNGGDTNLSLANGELTVSNIGAHEFDFVDPFDIEFGSDGRVYVADYGGNRQVRVYTDDFLVSGRIDDGSDGRPIAVSISNGFIYVSMFDTNRIPSYQVQIYDEVHRSDSGSSVPGALKIVVDSNDITHAILSGDSLEAYESFFLLDQRYNLRSSGESDSSTPNDLLIGPTTGWLYISDANQSHVPNSTIGGRNQVLVLSYDPDADRHSNYTLLGVLGHGTAGTTGTNDGEFNNPQRMHIHNGELYIVDQGNSRVQVFDVAE